VPWLGISGWPYGVDADTHTAGSGHVVIGSCIQQQAGPQHFQLNVHSSARACRQALVLAPPAEALADGNLSRLTTIQTMHQLLCTRPNRKNHHPTIFSGTEGLFTPHPDQRPRPLTRVCPLVLPAQQQMHQAERPLAAAVRLQQRRPTDIPPRRLAIPHPLLRRGTDAGCQGAGRCQRREWAQRGVPPLDWQLWRDADQCGVACVGSQVGRGARG